MTDNLNKNNKNLSIGKFVGVLIVIILLIGIVGFLTQTETEKSSLEDYKNTSYIINGEEINLHNGLAETKSSPGSASKNTTRYFGNELITDLNNDGREDVVFILTQETGGSGTFYYAVSSLNTENGYVGSEGYLLGDRIAPQTTELSQNPSHKNVIVVNYSDRAPNDPMTEKPSIGKSIWIKLNPETMQFGVVEQDFEGEADPSRMSLMMKDWTWIYALYNNDEKIESKQSENFVLTFVDEETFSAKTDCNRLSGSYEVSENYISFGPIAMTKMFCTDSQENDFVKLLENAGSYHFNSRGELIFDLKFDSGVMVFR
ncbi:META domain-containing protein [Candidatus Pacebacteria bacterium]|nr:META domain-containing protein [Candidatus Paceibacterota bacterium]